MGGSRCSSLRVATLLVAAVSLQLGLPGSGRAEGGNKLFDSVKQMGEPGAASDLLAQLEAELGGLMGASEPSGYVYVNQMGQRIEVPTEQDVPEQFRKYAQPVYPGKAPPRPTRPAGDSQIYKYTDHEGREVYTNIVEQIPVEDREAAKLDLSHITLNSQLGTQISQRLRTAHEELVESEYCEDVRANATTRVFKRIWDEYAPLIICGFLLLLFVFGSPYMVRRVGGPAWSRTLMFAIPVLLFAGFTMYSMTATNRAIHSFKAAQEQEDSCTQGAFAEAGAESGAGKLGAQLDLIKKMQTNMHSHIDGIGNIGSQGPGLRE